MTEKEFIYWLKGIVDSTDFMPTKKTWDTIVDKLKEVKECDLLETRQHPYVIINPAIVPQPKTPNEPPQILC
tara:strand:- start:156 stop:371 length:216 start_codon:yes stop_codon:yes gene_type:complete